jgi:hypothetical protein
MHPQSGLMVTSRTDAGILKVKDFPAAAEVCFRAGVVPSLMQMLRDCRARTPCGIEVSCENSMTS